MASLLAVRDAIRDFLRKFDVVLEPLFRFVCAMIIFSAIQKHYGYSDLFADKTMTFLLSVICAMVSTPVMIFVAAVVITINCFSVSLDVGATCAILAILMYCMYMRMFGNCGWILALVPLLYLWNLPYAIPIIVAIFAGFSGIVPTAFGIVIHYYTKVVHEVYLILQSPTKDKDFAGYKHIVDNLMKNKEMLLPIVAFAVVIMITAIIYLLPFDYSWYVAIGVGGILNILVFMLAGGKLGVTVDSGSLVFGSFIGMIVAAAIQAIKSLLAYSRKESVQFEDDDYYYYVKAIPKFNSKKNKKKVKNMTQDEEQPEAKSRREQVIRSHEQAQRNREKAGRDAEQTARSREQAGRNAEQTARNREQANRNRNRSTQKPVE